MKQRGRRTGSARAALARLVREPAVRRYDSAGHAESLSPHDEPGRTLIDAAEEMLRIVAESRARTAREAGEADGDAA